MSNTDVNTRTLDHIVHLSPPGKLEETAQLFRGFGFTVLKGGVHIDGLTENNLVTFQDGTYVELIAFTHPVSYYPPGSPEHIARESHPWASKHPGWIDYAFLGNGLLSPLSSRISTIINARGESEGSGVHYTDEEPLQMIVIPWAARDDNLILGIGSSRILLWGNQGPRCLVFGAVDGLATRDRGYVTFLQISRRFMDEDSQIGDPESAVGMFDGLWVFGNLS